MGEKKDLAVKEPEGGFSQEDVLEYVKLLDRRLFIVMHSGASWKPEYAQELEEIDKRFEELRVRLDAAHPARVTNICHAAAEGASMESLPCAGDELPFEDDSRCGECEYSESLDDDVEHQQLKEEVRQAYLNGGRTGYLYDIDGNEYYTTRDGIRHYTRLEG